LQLIIIIVFIAAAIPLLSRKCGIKLKCQCVSDSHNLSVICAQVLAFCVNPKITTFSCPASNEEQAIDRVGCQ